MDEILDFRHVRAFVALLAGCGSFSKTGRDLHYDCSPPSATRSRRWRTNSAASSSPAGQGVHLTHHGRAVPPARRTSCAPWRARDRNLGALDQTPRGRSARIGCTAAASQFILPTVFREFKESLPLYDIRVVPGETPEHDRTPREERDRSQRHASSQRHLAPRAPSHLRGRAREFCVALCICGRNTKPKARTPSGRRSSSPAAAPHLCNGERILPQTRHPAHIIYRTRQHRGDEGTRRSSALVSPSPPTGPRRPRSPPASSSLSPGRAPAPPPLGWRAPSKAAL